MPTPPPPDVKLTFGVEIECRLHMKLENNWDNTWKDAIVGEFVADGLPMRSASINGDMYDQWIVEPDPSINIYSRAEGSDGMEENGSVYVQAMEIKTPVLPFSCDGLQTLRNGVHILNRFETTLNDSTGLHVHIGQSIQGFPLRTISNVCAIMVGFEHLLSQLHSETRWNSLHCVPNSRNAAFLGCQSNLERVHKILLQRTYTDLKQTMQDSTSGACVRAFAVNIKSFLGNEGGYNQTRTLEFRSHRGSTDAQEIELWTRFVGAIVGFSHVVTDEGMYDLISRIANADFGTLDLIRYLQVPELCDYYEPILNRHSGNNSDAHVEVRDKFWSDIKAILESREHTMELIEQDYIKEGQPEVGSLSRRTTNNVQWRTVWIPWRRSPFTTAWDQKMEKWWLELCGPPDDSH